MGYRFGFSGSSSLRVTPERNMEKGDTMSQTEPGGFAAAAGPSPDTTTSALSGGPLSAALAALVMRVFAEYLGRGPTQARTTRSGNVIAVTAHDMMTKAERTLVDRGEAALVVDVRRKLQTAMRADLVSGVETLTDRTVVSFLSDHDAVHDWCAEVFVLDRPLDDD